ncbi:adenylate/guanylate cyclase domain-containing protein [Roseobacter sp. A03A-229]
MSDRKPPYDPGSEPVALAAPAVLPAETEEFRLALPVGLGAVLAASASLITCYSGILASYVVGTQAFMINPHVQAVLMWGLALCAVLFLWRDRRRHWNAAPLATGALAAATLIVTLYFGYDERVEALAYVLLVVGALLNQVLLLNTLNRKVREQAQQIDAFNQHLTHQVRRQEHEIDRLGRLKQFLAPQVAELVVAEGNEALLDTHRRYIACLFCDIRNFTAVSEAIEPEDVIAILQQFHDQVGALVDKHGGSIGYRAGDGLMVFFNDPIPREQPVLEAVRLALEIRSAFEEIRAPWSKLGHAIGLGMGVSSGYATLGLVGFHGRADYTAIGGVVNTAARLCDMAEDRELLISHRAQIDVDGAVEAEPLGHVELKGLANPVEIHRVMGLSKEALSDDR